MQPSLCTSRRVCPGSPAPDSSRQEISAAPSTSSNVSKNKNTTGLPRCRNCIAQSSCSAFGPASLGPFTSARIVFSDGSKTVRSGYPACGSRGQAMPPAGRIILSTAWSVYLVFPSGCFLFARIKFVHQRHRAETTRLPDRGDSNYGTILQVEAHVCILDIHREA